MSNYTKNNNFTSFDGTGKVISGVEFDSEFDEIATAIATKLDAATANLGKVLQVVYANAASDVTRTNSTTPADSATASITPSAVSSKILVLCNQCSILSTSGANQGNISFYIDRDGTNIYTPGNTKIQDTYLNFGMIMSQPAHYLDSPATTSSVTYTIKAYNVVASGTFISQEESSITLLEIGA